MNRERAIKGAMLVLAMLVGAGCGSGGGSDSQEPSRSLTPVPAVASLLYTTDTALMRVNTNGTGVVTLDDTHTGIWSVRVAGDTLVYMVDAGSPDDLWTVKVDGTNRRELVRDAYLHDVIGSRVLYGVPVGEALASIRLDGTGARRIFEQPHHYAAQVAGRVVIASNFNYVSLLPDGTDPRQLTFYPPYSDTEPFTVLIWVNGAVGTTALYTILESSPVAPDSPLRLFAVSVLGGPTVRLGEGPDQDSFMAVVGTRVVYGRCVVRMLPDFEIATDRCNIFSVLSTGQGRIALTNTDDINWVQGTIGQQVIIRRSQRGGRVDTLVGVPLTGGPETPILTLDPNEFVVAIVGNRIVLQRATGLWSILADGSELVRLSESITRYSFVAIGSAHGCFLRGQQLWCVPVDGNAAAIQVADEAKAIIALD
jgi:hypothetical protein